MENHSSDTTLTSSKRRESSDINVDKIKEKDERLKRDKVNRWTLRQADLEVH